MMKRTSRVSQKTKMLEARPYQVEMANIARNESVIVKLSTGLGKSFIAAMVIKDHLPETYRPVSEGGKRIILVAKTGGFIMTPHFMHPPFLKQALSTLNFI